MKTFLNVIWYFPYFGFLLALPMAIFGLFWCITIVGLPLGLGMLQIAKFLLFPHTHSLVSQSAVNKLKGKEQNELWRIFSIIVSILYFPIGLIAAVIYILAALANFITILGIPNGLVIIKMLGAVFNPVNKICVPDYVASHIKTRNDQQRLDNYLGTANSQTQNQNQANETQYTPSPQQAQANVPQTRNFTDEHIAEIIANPLLYNSTLVEQCVAERDLRERSATVMPIAEGYSVEKLQEIAARPEEYSAELVYCAQILLDRKHEQIAAEKAAQAAEAERMRQEEIERRKQQAIDFFIKWKYAIIGGILAIIVISIFLWICSDSHRFSVACEASDNEDYTTALEYAYKIDNPSSKYFDPATALAHRSWTRIDDRTKKDDAIGEKIIKRIEQTVTKPDAVDKHSFLTRYYCNALYNQNPDSTNLTKIAEILQNSNDVDARCTAGVAYFLSKQYYKAEAIFEDIAINNDEPSAYAYMAVMNIFGLCSNFSREDGWRYLDQAPSQGMIALLQGDKVLNSSNKYKSRLEKAASYYLQASTPDIPIVQKALQLRKHVVDECLENLSTYGYRFGWGSYEGQTKYFDGVYQPWGWGYFKFDSGGIRYGKFKFKSKNNISEDSDCTFWIGINEDDKSTWLSAITEYKDGDSESYIFNHDGSFHTKAYIFSFVPEWYRIQDPILDANFCLTDAETAATSDFFDDAY